MLQVAYQQTLANSAICAGIGVHSGERVRLSLKPLSENSGIVFNRTDVASGQGVIAAKGDLVFDTQLGTKLKNEHGVTLSTVEHLLSAVYGLGIDNMLIEVDGPEIPIMDGSSELFADLILQTGIKSQSALKKSLRILQPVHVKDGVKSASLLPVKDDGFHLDATIDFKNELIGRQRVEFELTPKTFQNDIAFARTFGMTHELEYLRSMGLGRGASMENAIAVEDNKVLNPEGLRSEDEFVRHKVLDAIGDLALIGLPVIGRYVAEQPGHSINNQLVRALLSDPSKWVLESHSHVEAPIDETMLSAAQ